MSSLRLSGQWSVCELTGVVRFRDSESHRTPPKVRAGTPPHSVLGMDEPSFWGALGAMATASATLSGLVAWIVALVVSRRARPEANWVELRRSAERYPTVPHMSDISFVIVLVNVGDDSAFDVKVIGLHCEARVQIPKPVAPPSEHLTIFGTCTPDDQKRATVVVEWTRRPTRQGRRLRHLVPLANLDVTMLPDFRKKPDAAAEA